jgi:hypothetical protein
VAEPKVETPTAQAKAEKSAPVEIKVPDGASIDKASMEGFVKVAGELGLDSVKAQKIADHYFSMQKTSLAAQAEQSTKWAEEAKADPEIGGAKFDATLDVAKKALDRFGGTDLKELLVSTGLGNHKAIIRAFAKAGQAIAEDKIAPTAGMSGGGELSPAEIAAKWYPTMQHKP